MAHIRAKSEGNPQLRRGWAEAVEPVQGLVRNRLTRLSLKQEPIKAIHPVSADEIDTLKRHLRELFPTLNLEKLQKTHTRKVDSYNIWIERHCKVSQYVFQIRKCSDESCCVTPSLPHDDLSWLPDPVLDTDGEHYKPYSTVKNTETNEADRPSLNDGKRRRTKASTSQPASVHASALQPHATPQPTCTTQSTATTQPHAAPHPTATLQPTATTQPPDAK